MVQISTRCQRRPRRLWPRHLPHGSIKQIKYLLNRVSWRQLSSCNRLLHSVVNNSCGFNPQRKVVALIFSAARLPRLLEEICWQFAAGLPAFSSLPFFRTQTPTCLQSWLHFRTPGRAPKKGPCPSFQDSVPIGEEFGAQIWGPDLGPNFGAQIWAPPSHAFLVARLKRDGLAMVQISTRCQRRPRRLWPRHLPHGSIKQIKYLLNRVSWRQLSSCNRRGPTRRSQKCLVFPTP